MRMDILYYYIFVAAVLCIAGGIALWWERRHPPKKSTQSKMLDEMIAINKNLNELNDHLKDRGK
jgi:predicted small integral membrane protein